MKMLIAALIVLSCNATAGELVVRFNPKIPPAEHPALTASLIAKYNTSFTLVNIGGGFYVLQTKGDAKALFNKIKSDGLFSQVEPDLPVKAK